MIHDGPTIERLMSMVEDLAFTVISANDNDPYIVGDDSAAEAKAFLKEIGKEYDEHWCDSI